MKRGLAWWLQLQNNAGLAEASHWITVALSKAERPWFPKVRKVQAASESRLRSAQRLSAEVSAQGTRSCKGHL